jgi:RNA polymerase sigma-70 factor (ECF subfamily)
MADEDLMLLVRAGSREAMGVLASRHVGPLTSFCAKLTGDVACAEDLVQEVLLRLWRRRAAWEPRGRVLAFLYMAARNLCRNRARDVQRRGRWVVDGNEAETPAPPEGDVEALLASERRRDTLRALQSLPDLMREAVLLRFDGEMSYEAIAAIVGAPESTVRSRVHYGLLRMREVLKDGGQGAGKERER